MYSQVYWDELPLIHTPPLDKWAYADHTSSVETKDENATEENKLEDDKSQMKSQIFSLYPESR